MFLEIPDVLTPEETARLRDLAAKGRFLEGRLTNPSNVTKNNLQADTADPSYAESTRIVGMALSRCQPFLEFSFPRTMAPPLLCKYQPGMTYGAHGDAAYVNQPNGQRLRSDLSCTVWLNDPASYQGGELAIYMGAREISIKCPPGWAVVYPSTFLHEVKPVTAGERLVSITFIESLVPDAEKRDVLYSINEIYALEGLKMSWENRQRLQLASQNLMRMWTAG